MATKLKRLPRRSMWEQYADGSAWQLKAGKDFAITPRQARNSIYQFAFRRGMKASVRLIEGGLAVQFVKRKKRK
jgi:hypothetical protein